MQVLCLQKLCSMLRFYSCPCVSYSSNPAFRMSRASFVWHPISAGNVSWYWCFDGERYPSGVDNAIQVGSHCLGYAPFQHTSFCSESLSRPVYLSSTRSGGVKSKSLCVCTCYRASGDTAGLLSLLEPRCSTVVASDAHDSDAY